jgi:hypothetical protein
MNTNILNFERIDNVTYRYLNQGSDDPTPIRIGSNGMQLNRAYTNNDDNMLYNTTIEALGSTTIGGAVDATDWEDGKYSFIEDSTSTQQIKIEMGSGEEFYLKKLTIKTILESGDSIKTPVIVEISEDDTNYVKLLVEISDNIITAYTDINVGLYCKYIKFTFSGTTLDTERIVIADIRAYRAVYINKNVTIEHKDTYITDTFTGITPTVITPVGTSIKYQVLKNSIPYYWNGSAWKQTVKNVMYDNINCSTSTEITSNASTFPITSGEKVTIGVCAIFFNTEDVTPRISSLTISV